MIIYRPLLVYSEAVLGPATLSRARGAVSLTVCSIARLVIERTAVGCYRHYDEETDLYTVTFFGVMTAKDFYAERGPIYADVERYRPQKRLLDYSMCHPKINPFELQRLSASERRDLYEGVYSALVVNTALKRGMTNVYLTVSGAADHIKAFSSLVDAKLWLSSRPDRATAAVGSRSLRLLALVLLLSL